VIAATQFATSPPAHGTYRILPTGGVRTPFVGWVPRPHLYWPLKIPPASTPVQQNQYLLRPDKKQLAGGKFR